jgi:hypothetical protein
MQSQWGNWHADPAAGQILFDSPSTREAYNRGNDEYVQASNDLGTALRAWKDFNAAPKNQP